MKQKILAFLLLALTVLGLAVPVAAAEYEYVFDTAAVLSDSEAAGLEARAAEISGDYQCGVYIVTIPTYYDYDSDVYQAAKVIYQDNGFGLGADSDGFLLLLSMDDREYALIATGDLGNAALTDYGRSQMEGEFVDNFQVDDWLGGFEDYLDRSVSYLEAYYYGEPFDVDTDPEYDGEGGGLIMLVIIIGVSCLVALIVCMIFKSQMKTAERKTEARDYIAAEGLQLRVREDTYLHTTETRRAIPKNDDSGGTTTDRDGFSGSKGSF